MRSGVIAQKVGMTRVYNDAGEHVPVTVLRMENCQVVSHRTTEKNGYVAVQLGAGQAKVKNTTKALRGQFAAASVEPKAKLVEFRVSEDNLIDVGTEIKAGHFAAGQQRYMPEFMAMYAQTVNSYTRLVPGYRAPLEASLGIENRTTALRIIPGGPKSQRVEVRIGSADANPYIALAAALGSGLLGIEQKLEPTFTSGNAYTQKFPDDIKFPSTLWESAQRLRASTAARGLFGDAFVDQMAATREWEERKFREYVTDWELQRYFELI